MQLNKDMQCKFILRLAALLVAITAHAEQPAEKGGATVAASNVPWLQSQLNALAGDIDSDNSNITYYTSTRDRVFETSKKLDAVAAPDVTKEISDLEKTLQAIQGLPLTTKLDYSSVPELRNLSVAELNLSQAMTGSFKEITSAIARQIRMIDNDSNIGSQIEDSPRYYIDLGTVIPKTAQLVSRLQNNNQPLSSEKLLTRQSIEALLSEAIAEIPSVKTGIENDFNTTKAEIKAYLDRVKDILEKEIARNQTLLEKHNNNSKDISKQMEALTNSQNKSVENLIGNLPWIVGMLCALFGGLIFIIRTFPAEIQIEWVASGQVIQLLTVVTLLLIILCLAVTHVIQENTVGTLLGGIGGYVLSQGIGRAAAREASRNK